MNQDEVIGHLLETYNAAVGSHYQVTSRPDVDNRDSADIDAIANSPGFEQLAIEHTRIQSLENQNRDSAWFMRGLGDLGRELDGAFPFRLDLVLPYRNVEPGQDWPAIKASVKTWLLANAQNLSYGRTTHEAEGVPFQIITGKHASDRHRVFLMRHEPDGNIDDLVLIEMQRSLDHKYGKLGEYRARGDTAVLVLESEDIALVSEASLYKAFLQATQVRPRPNLDQVWIASTFREDCSVYCFVGPAEVMKGANPENFCFGPQYAAEWLRSTTNVTA